MKYYYRTKSDLLTRIYIHIKNRDKELDFDKEWFFDFAVNSEAFNRLYHDWVLSDQDRNIMPSLDRIDSSKGYLKDNVQWIDLRSNTAKLFLDIIKNPKKTNASGVTGVSWSKERKKWCAYVRINGKMKSLGRFTTFEGASKARKTGEKEKILKEAS